MVCGVAARQNGSISSDQPRRDGCSRGGAGRSLDSIWRRPDTRRSALAGLGDRAGERGLVGRSVLTCGQTVAAYAGARDPDDETS